MADGSFNAGSAQLTIKPRLATDFRQQLRTQLRSVNVEHKVTISPDLTGFRQKLQTAVKSAKAEVKVNVTPDMTGFRTKLNAAVRGTNAPEIKVRVIPDMTGFSARLRAMTRSVSGADVRIRPTIDGTAFHRNLRAAIRSADKDLAINVSVDLAQARADMTAFREWASRPLHINVDLDSAAAMAQLSALMVQAIGLQATLGRLNIPAGGIRAAGGAMSGFLGVAQPAVMALGALAATNIVPLVGQLAQAAGVLSLIPAAAGAAAASLATVVIGSTGIVDAFKAAGEASKDATQNAAANAKKQRDAARQVEDAQRGVADAHEDAAQAAKDGARQIVQAERQVQDAQKRTQQAQEDLTRARKDAVEQIEDLNLALKGSSLDEEDAMIALERARERLRDLGKDGDPVSGLDRREAENNVRQALQRVDEVRERNNDLRLETQEANKAGVEGAAQVVAAKDAVAEAIQGERDATENLAVTRENVDRQIMQSQRQIEDALRRVADAQEAQAEALTSTSSAVDKYAEALANLSPNARQFVEQTRAMGDEWRNLRMQIQDNLFAGLGGSIQDLANNYFPILRTGLGGIATEINGGLKRAIEDLNTESVKLDWSTILDNTRLAIGPFMDGISSLVGALTNIAKIGSSFLPAGAESFAETMQRFEDWTESPEGQQKIRDFMQKSIDSLRELKDLFLAIGRVVGGLFATSEENGKSMIQSMTDGLNRFADWLNTPEGRARMDQFWDDAQQTAKDMLRLTGEAIKLADKVSALVGNRFGLTNGQQNNTDENGNPVAADGETPVKYRAGIFPGVKEGSVGDYLITGANGEGQSALGKSVRGAASFFGWNTETNEFDGGVWPSHLEEMGREWGVFTGSIKTGWTDHIGPVFTSIGEGTANISGWFVDRIRTSSVNSWNSLRDAVTDGWGTIRTNWEILRTEGLGGLANEFVSKITNGAVTTWQELPSAIGEGARTIIDEHFPWLGSALDTLEGVFQRGVDRIGGIWDGLKEKLASPINWVIENVFNKLISAWNAIAPKIGLPEIQPIGLMVDGAGDGGGFSKVKQFNRGGTVDGVMSGYSPGRDDRIIAVGGGEAVMRPEWTRAVGKDFVENANAAARSGGVSGARKFMGYFNRGGIVESMEAVVRKHFPMLLTNDRAFSGLRFTDDGYHSKGMAGDFSNGGDAGTPEMKAFANYVADEYQNRTLELIHSPFNRNINNYKDVGDGFGFYGAGTMNQHRNHVHWAVDGPVGEGGAPDPSLWDKIKSGVGGVVSRVSTFFRNLVADQFEKPVNALGSIIPNPFPGIGDFGYVPKKMYDTLTGKALDWVRGKAEAKDNAAGSSGSSGAPLGAFGGNSMDYAREIVEAAKERGLPSKAAKIALMTAMAESSLKMWANNSVPESLNYPHDAIRSDYDSVGLFQQRDNGAWGTVEQRMNPRASAGMFYDALMGVDWQSMSPAQAAQAVQRSAFADGSNYAAHEGRADELVAQLYDAGGVIEPNKLAVNLSGKPEAVFTNEEWMLIHELVRLLGMTDFVDKLAASDGPKELSGEQLTGLPSTYGTGEGTVAAGGYTLPTGELSKDLRAFDKLHGNQSSGSGGSKFPAFGSPEHVQQAGAIFQNATSTFAGRAKDAGMQFLSGWIPDELMNPQGLVGGLISAGKELSGWFHENHGTPDLFNDPIGSLGQIAGGFIGGGTPPPMPMVDPGAVQQQVDSLRNNAPAQASGTGSAGDTYNFYANNAEELWRRFQTMQAQKAAGFIGR